MQGPSGPNFPAFSDMQTVSNYPPGHCEEHMKREQSLYVFKESHSHVHGASDSGWLCHGLCQDTGLPGRLSCCNKKRAVTSATGNVRGRVMARTPGNCAALTSRTPANWELSVNRSGR